MSDVDITQYTPSETSITSDVEAPCTSSGSLSAASRSEVSTNSSQVRTLPQWHIRLAAKGRIRDRYSTASLRRDGGHSDGCSDGVALCI